MASPASDQGELWWTVALESTLFFSIPTWMLTVGSAWPANDPRQFTLALLLGASAATVFCHVAPAFWGRMVSSMVLGRLAGLLKWPILVWLGGGAALWLGRMSAIPATMLWAWGEDSPGRFVPGVLTAAGAMAVTAVGWTGPGRNRVAMLLCCGLGVVLLLGMFVAHSPGLWTRNPQMSSEAGLDDPPSMFGGMLLASAPAALLAVRLGRMGVSTRQIWWSGFAGVGVPLVASVALASLSRMSGARLYWKPSLPVGFEFALLGGTDSRILQCVWILAGLTAFGTCVAWATWLRHLTEAWRWTRNRAAAAIVLGTLTYGLTFVGEWQFAGMFYRAWCISIILGSGALGFGCLVLRRRKAPRQQR